MTQNDRANFYTSTELPWETISEIFSDTQQEAEAPEEA